MSEKQNAKTVEFEEFAPRGLPGIPILALNTLATLAFAFLAVRGGIFIEAGRSALGGLLLAAGLLYVCVIAPILYRGLKVLKPNDVRVFTLFGKYAGTLGRAGFYFVNPFMTVASGRYVSLKATTLNNDQQKINDQLGNPVVIGIVVVWRVVNAAMAVFNVDNYREFLSIQSDAALRGIAREYTYDTSGDDDEKTLRGSSQEIAERLKSEIQAKTRFAGLEIIEARITHLSYAPEIAAAMLQRQQAAAIIDARKLIVDGAVGMVEMALGRLGERGIVNLDEERKAAMVSNLLVVLCGNRDAQPIVNSGSIY